MSRKNHSGIPEAVLRKLVFYQDLRYSSRADVAFRHHVGTSDEEGLKFNNNC